MNLTKRIPLLVMMLIATVAVADQSALKPPAGAKVAIIEFVDLECPMCAHAAPIVKEAADKYNIPLVRHDFLIPGHPWSRRAAILARYFDTKSTKSEQLGTEFRDYIFANQTDIDPGNLTDVANKFATQHHLQLPFQIDPTGELEKKVNADMALGQSLGVNGTPAIWIVGEGVAPYKMDSTELNINGRLDQLIESTKQQVEDNAPKTTSTHHATKKK